MRKMNRIAVAAAFSLCLVAQAQEVFVVSGILKRNDSQDVVRCVHGMVLADDAEQAKQVFEEKAKSEFPQYTAVQLIASDVPTLAKPLVPTPSEGPTKLKLSTSI